MHEVDKYKLISYGFSKNINMSIEECECILSYLEGHDFRLMLDDDTGKL